MPIATIPRGLTIPAALRHLDDQGDADGQAAYLELLAITGRRESCPDCVVANYLRETTGCAYVEVNPVTDWGRKHGQRGTVTDLYTDERWDLSADTNTLACRFDEHDYVGLTGPCTCGAQHEHKRVCPDDDPNCAARTCEGHDDCGTEDVED